MSTQPGRVRDPFTEPRPGDIFDCCGMHLHVSEVDAATNIITYYCSDALGRGVGPRRSLSLNIFLHSIGPLDRRGEKRATLIYAAR
jgi:hypothetical protein